MITINQLNKKQEDYIRNLDVSALKNYIDNIAKTYYLNIINEDRLSANNSIETLNKIKMLHSEKNLDTYINHSLIKVFNEILITGSSGNINGYLNEPQLNINNKGFVAKSELDNIFNGINLEKALQIEKEYQKKYTDRNGILKLYNYNKYKA